MLAALPPLPGARPRGTTTNFVSHTADPYGLIQIPNGVTGGTSGGGSGVTAPTGDIANDPVYQQALADEKAALDAASGRRDSLTNQAMIQFGAVPDLASIGRSLGLSPDQINAITGELNPETGALASQYTQSGNSVMARLNKAHDDALTQLRASLAAHGMLESGATGVGVKQGNDNYQQGLSSAMQQLLGNLLGYQDQFAQDSQAARQTLTGAAGSAYDRQVQMAQQNPDTGGGGGAGGSGAASPTQSMVDNAATSGTGYRHVPIATGPLRPRTSVLPNAYTTGRKRFG